MGMCIIRNPEGILPLHTGRALLSHFRRIDSVAHFRALLSHFQRIDSVAHFRARLSQFRRIDSVAHFHTLFPRTRRFASVAHDVRFFRFPEGMLPLRTASYSFRSSEELLPSYVAHSASAIPKVRFRFARCTFLPPPRRDASATHGLPSLLPVAPKNTASV
jgi:hypothetical protein